MLLLTLGGLGFPVLYESTYKLTSMLPPWNRTRKRHMYSIHTRIVLRSTLLLILLGIIAMLLSENGTRTLLFLYLLVFPVSWSRSSNRRFQCCAHDSVCSLGIDNHHDVNVYRCRSGRNRRRGQSNHSQSALLFWKSNEQGASQGGSDESYFAGTCGSFSISHYWLCPLLSVGCPVLLVWAEPELPFDLLFELISAFGTSDCH